MNLKHTSLRLLTGTMLGIMALDVSAIMAIRPVPMKGHQHDRSAPKVFNLTGFENSQIKFITPDLQSSDIETTDGKISIRATGKNNYHVLYALRNNNGVEESAIRYIPFNGKPTGHSPSEITSLNKTDFEIVPDPLAREHWHHKAGDSVAYVVRFKNRPVASLPVSLATSNSSIVKSITDKQGRVTFTLPDDFANTKPGKRANKPGELLIHAKYSDNNKAYATWLSSDYQVDPKHWQSTELGTMVLGGGFLIGAFITGLGLKRNKQKGKK